jgi:hypothetical protein
MVATKDDVLAGGGRGCYHIWPSKTGTSVVAADKCHIVLLTDAVYPAPVTNVTHCNMHCVNILLASLTSLLLHNFIASEGSSVEADVWYSLNHHSFFQCHWIMTFRFCPCLCNESLSGSEISIV